VDRLRAHNTLAFLHRNELIRTNVGQRFPPSARPHDLNADHLSGSRLAQSVVVEATALSFISRNE